MLRVRKSVIRADRYKGEKKNTDATCKEKNNLFSLLFHFQLISRFDEVKT